MQIRPSAAGAMSTSGTSRHIDADCNQPGAILAQLADPDLVSRHRPGRCLGCNGRLDDAELVGTSPALAHGELLPGRWALTTRLTRCQAPFAKVLAAYRQLLAARSRSPAWSPVGEPGKVTTSLTPVPPHRWTLTPPGDTTPRDANPSAPCLPHLAHCRSAGLRLRMVRATGWPPTGLEPAHEPTLQLSHMPNEPPESTSESHQSSVRSLVGGLLIGRGWQVARLATTSFIGGLAEAAFLVLITRSAFAVAEGAQSLKLFSDQSISLTAGVGAALALVLIRVLAASSAVWQSATLTTEVVTHTRYELSTAFLEAAWPVQQADRAGRLQELLTTFVSQGTALLTNLTTTVVSGFSLLALLGTAVFVDPIGALAVITGALILGFALRPLRRIVRARAQETAASGIRFASSLNEISQLGMEVHVFHLQRQAERRVRELVDKNANDERRLNITRGLVAPAYTGLAYLAIVGALVTISIMNPTDIAALGAVMLVMLRSLSYGQTIQTTIAAITGAIPYIEQLNGQIEAYHDGRQHDGGVPIGEIGQLKLLNVTFSYEPGKVVLHDLTLTIDRNEIIGIIGPSGGGKSTLVQLLLGLREQDSGTILSAGRPISELSRSEWARRVTFVPQVSHLIAGSVADNIRLMRDHVSQGDIEHAARLAHLSDDIAGFVGGYEREVGERGEHLSGGQQQRLCIARALVERPDVLVLDEPTSALDVHSEHLIRTTLGELRERMTIIIVAHRLSTLDICDRIMVIQDGELKGFDTPERLQASNAFYSEALKLSGLR